MRFKGVLARLGAVLLVVAATGWTPVRAQDAFQQGLDAYLRGEYREALALWQPAAGSGDEVAAFNIGVLYARGLGVDADPAQALRWYRQSALAGYANAQFNLGAAYFNGAGTERNVGQAISWWEKAVEQNHPEAMYNLAVLYRDGEVVEQDKERAAALFGKSAAAGDARAESALEALRGRESRNEETASEPAAPAAGVATPSTSDRNWPGGENPSHWAVQVFAVAEKAAAQRFVIDHELTGTVRIYRAEVEGKTWFKGVSGSYAEADAAKAARDEFARTLPGASPWLRRYRDIQAEAVGAVPVSADTTEGAAGTQAARESLEAPPAGNGAGQDATGADVPDGSEEAASSPATKDSPETPQRAEQGGDDTQAETEPEEDSDDGPSRLIQGQRAFNAQNYDQALEAWQPLAEQGVADAQYGIGFMYESGWGVDQDYSRAYRWYQLAAQQGHVKSQFNLGMLYRNGKGVAQNDALGLYWIQTAADRGDERALNYLKNLNQ